MITDKLQLKHVQYRNKVYKMCFVGKYLIVLACVRVCFQPLLTLGYLVSSLPRDLNKEELGGSHQDKRTQISQNFRDE